MAKKNIAELTPGILKSVESAVHVVSENSPRFMVKYRGKLFQSGGDRVRLFRTEGAAKTMITTFVKEMFWHGQYWQSCSSQIKTRTGYEVDFSETIRMLSSYGETSRFSESENKKMFKSIAEQLIEQKIFTIEEI